MGCILCIKGVLLCIREGDGRRDEGRQEYRRDGQGFGCEFSNEVRECFGGLRVGAYSASVPQMPLKSASCRFPPRLCPPP